jgi:L-asparaginase II
MVTTSHQPIFELTRGKIVESIHYGSIAVVDIQGRLLAGIGDPDFAAYLRSSSKPIQALPLLAAGGKEFFGIDLREIAIMCASHSGTDEHIEVVKGLQDKLKVLESELLCGTHLPFYAPAADRLKELGLQPAPNHHNCSGKHTGMLGYHRLLSNHNPSQENISIPYIDPNHPVQEHILSMIAQMSGLDINQVTLGIDGCSAPNFAIPLSRAAFAFARLCDPINGGVKGRSLITACKTVVSAMSSYPFLVAGPGRFDTQLMQVSAGRIISKGGAEGYQAIGLLPDAIEPGSPAIGIAIKIADGDHRGTVKSAIALEVLRQINALSPAELDLLRDLGPVKAIRNWQNIEVGVSQPTIRLFQSQ